MHYIEYMIFYFKLWCLWNHAELDGGQPSGSAQDLGRNGNLSDVMDDSGHPQSFDWRVISKTSLVRNTISLLHRDMVHDK
jgi:hypothetical protein